MTDPTPLSPAAKAVLDATMGLASTAQAAKAVAAATLRAAADQVVPREPHPGESQFWDDDANREWQNNQSIRKQIFAIATELEGVNG